MSEEIENDQLPGTLINGQIPPGDSKFFALIVDGEVALNLKLPSMFEKIVAIFQSNPTIVEVDEEIQEGSTWDGQEFTPPAE